MKDTGSGIDPEDFSKLFSRFGKLHRTAEMNHEGIGMGLTIVKQIVEKSGGLIAVWSEGLGKGSYFYFNMPLKIAPQEIRSGIIKVEDVRIEEEVKGERYLHEESKSSEAHLQDEEEEEELEIEDMDQSSRSLVVHNTQQLEPNESENDHIGVDLEDPEVQRPHIEDANKILIERNQDIINKIMRELEG